MFYTFSSSRCFYDVSKGGCQVKLYKDQDSPSGPSGNQDHWVANSSRRLPLVSHVKPKVIADLFHVLKLT